MIVLRPYLALFISLPLISYTILESSAKLLSSSNLQAFSFHDMLGLRFPNPRNVSLVISTVFLLYTSKISKYFLKKRGICIVCK